MCSVHTCCVWGTFRKHLAKQTALLSHSIDQICPVIIYEFNSNKDRPWYGQLFCLEWTYHSQGNYAKLWGNFGHYSTLKPEYSCNYPIRGSNSIIKLTSSALIPPSLLPYFCIDSVHLCTLWREPSHLQVVSRVTATFPSAPHCVLLTNCPDIQLLSQPKIARVMSDYLPGGVWSSGPRGQAPSTWTARHSTRTPPWSSRCC